MVNDGRIIFGDAGEYIRGDGANLDIVSSAALTVATSTDINLEAGRHILLKTAGTGQIYFDSEVGIFNFLDASDSDDAFKITVVGGTGATTLETLSDGDDGHLILDADGDLTLDSNSGNFVAKKAGTEFSAANSAYAGMILGYTVIGLDATPATFDVTTAMLPVHDDLKVSFVFPPSGNVEIFASIYIQTDASRAVTFGLSTTDASTGFTSLGAKYENHTHFADETDGTQHSHRWYVTGTAGDAEELWFAAGTTQAGRIDLFWGGDSSAVADSTHPIEYQPFVMKAAALPATIYEG